MGLPASDDFNRSDRSLNGDPLSDGVNTWVSDGASIVSNMCYGNVVVSTLSGVSVEDVDVSMTAPYDNGTVKEQGPITRHSGSSAFYWLEPSDADDCRIRKFNGSITNLTSYVRVAYGSKKLTLRSVGTTHKILDDGVEKASVTDSTHTGAKGVGIHGRNAPRYGDNFEAVAYSAGASAISGSTSGAGAASGTLSGSGALAGSAAGEGAAGGALKGEGALSGAATGVATGQGVLAGAGALLGATSGTSSPGGTLSGLGALSGQAAGVSTATGALDTVAGAALVRIYVFSFNPEIEAAVSDPASEIFADDPNLEVVSHGS